MKKSLILAAIAGAFFASCANDDFVGGSQTQQSKTEAINFGGRSTNLTRAAATGDAAATLLGNQFRVYGTLTNASNAVEEIFDNYILTWEGGPDDADDSNEFGWSYLTTPGQNIKYWNLGAKEYNFVAFSGYNPAIRIASTESNTLENIDLTTAENLYASDRVTADYSGTKGVVYGGPVNLTFKRMYSRVRFGLYETVPGYAVTNVRFYYGTNALTTNTSLATTVPGLRGNFPVKGNYVITYDADNAVVSNLQSGAEVKDNHVFGGLEYTTADATNGLKLKADGSSDATGDAVFLGTNSTLTSFATTAGEAWVNVLPNQANDKNLVLRVDFDLVPLDGTVANPGDGTIHVYNAAAVVPAEWCQWKPNYAYTYIFKISDQTKGQTWPPYVDPTKDTDGDGIPDIDDPDIDGDGIPNGEDPDIDGDGIPNGEDPTPDGIGTPEEPDFDVVPVDPDTENPNPNKPAVSPIVFDATVSAIEDFNEETITNVTTLGGNSITTYSETSNVTNAAEYAVGEHIKVSSISHGRWGVVYTPTETTEKALEESNTLTYDFIAGVPGAGETIDEVSVYNAEFDVTAAGYYVVWLRYLPTGMADLESNYVDVFKVIKTHN